MNERSVRRTIVGIDPSHRHATGVAVATFDENWIRIKTNTAMGEGRCTYRLLDILGEVKPDLVLVEYPTFAPRGLTAGAAKGWGRWMLHNHVDWDARFVCPIDWQYAILGPVAVSGNTKAKSLALSALFTGSESLTDDIADAVMLTEYGKKLMLGLNLKTVSVRKVCR